MAGETPGSEGFSQSEIDALLAADSAAAAEGSAPAASGASAATPASGGATSAPSASGPPPLDSMGRPFDDAAAAMAAAIAEEKAASAAASAAPAAASPATAAAATANVPTYALPALDAKGSANASNDPIALLSDVELDVTIELGRTQMMVEEVLRLGEGAVVELDKLAGDPVDVYVNERLVARGEVLVLNDNFCVRVSEIISTDPSE